VASQSPQQIVQVPLLAQLGVQRRWFAVLTQKTLAVRARLFAEGGAACDDWELATDRAAWGYGWARSAGGFTVFDNILDRGAGPSRREE